MSGHFHGLIPIRMLDGGKNVLIWRKWRRWIVKPVKHQRREDSRVDGRTDVNNHCLLVKDERHMTTTTDDLAQSPLSRACASSYDFLLTSSEESVRGRKRDENCFFILLLLQLVSWPAERWPNQVWRACWTRWSDGCTNAFVLLSQLNRTIEQKYNSLDKKLFIKFQITQVTSLAILSKSDGGGGDQGCMSERAIVGPFIASS